MAGRKIGKEVCTQEWTCRGWCRRMIVCQNRFLLVDSERTPRGEQ
jgi:hypothetical protein